MPLAGGGDGLVAGDGGGGTVAVLTDGAGVLTATLALDVVTVVAADAELLDDGALTCTFAFGACTDTCDNLQGSDTRRWQFISQGTTPLHVLIRDAR